MSGLNNEGSSHAIRSMNQTSAYLPNGGLDANGGGTYTSATTEPTIKDYENVFGPSARDIKEDLQRYKRHGRWHLPDILKGPNPWLADRIDGLITDAASSPFTSTILPYRYFDNVDGKLKWNVWSFDEAMPSRVPYEAAARTLTQTKRSFSGYAVRHGLAITLEHNFMMTPKGRENFQNQLNQLVGSIQYANDLDVHMALLLAPSYEKHMMEKYNNYNKSATQTCREYVDLFGFMQKNQNGLDILIEEAKLKLKTWGAPTPNFMLTNSKLTFQLTMTPERTNYITQGIDGVKRLRQGPDLQSYRGISIVPSRAFSMETGQPPRDVMRRRVRVAEYYRIMPDADNHKRTYELYNEERDTFFTILYRDLFKMAMINGGDDRHEDEFRDLLEAAYQYYSSGNHGAGAGGVNVIHHYALEQLKDALNKKTLAADTAASSAESYAHIQKSPICSNWMKLLQILHQSRDSLAANAVVIPPEKLIASVFPAASTAASSTESMVFAPLASSLHFSVAPHSDGDVDMQVNTEYLHEQWPSIPQHLLSKVQHSLVQYPRLTAGQNLRSPEYLRSPFTFTECDKGSIEYHEARVGLARMFRRYAAPSSFLKSFNNQDKLMFNAACLDQDDLHVGQMFYQPLGAFNEPNHPLFVEQMPLGKARDVHNGWILTEDLLDYLLVKDLQPQRLAVAAEAAAGVDGRNISRAEYSVKVAAAVEQALQAHGFEARKGLAAQQAVYTWGVHDTYLSTNDYLNPTEPTGLSVKAHQALRKSAPRGLVTNEYLAKLVDMAGEQDLGNTHPWLQKCQSNGTAIPDLVVDGLRKRLNEDAYAPSVANLADSIGAVRLAEQLLASKLDDTHICNSSHFAESHMGSGKVFLGVLFPAFEQLKRITHDPHSKPGDIDRAADEAEKELEKNKILFDPLRWEFVIVRPNIEHYMIGIILGLSGDQLGNTLWGQTELSVYDDSQHGVWGMSYKYHERAIVFNEKNLIRLWDIAYDGYNGGKDDSFVNWTQGEDVNKFKEDTMDVTRDYRGKSMMVMAFYHGPEKMQSPEYLQHFKTNWPSPILFYDRDHEQLEHNGAPAGPENNTMISTKEFKVFHHQVYPQYPLYQKKMPDFKELHQMRKSAAESSRDDETQVDCLAFQGTLRIKQNGSVIDQINGSGHHGVDYVGVSSVRAGKGYKMTGGISQIVRQI